MLSSLGALSDRQPVSPSLHHTKPSLGGGTSLALKPKDCSSRAHLSRPRTSLVVPPLPPDSPPTSAPCSGHRGVVLVLFCLHLCTPGMAHPKIKIEDGVHQIRTGSTIDEQSTWQRPDIGPSTGIAGGIYYGRRLSRSTNDRRSISRSRANESKPDIEAGDNWLRNDGRKKQVFKGRTLLWSVSTSSYYAANGR